jgi:hypothetical protein
MSIASGPEQIIIAHGDLHVEVISLIREGFGLRLVIQYEGQDPIDAHLSYDEVLAISRWLLEGR